MYKLILSSIVAACIVAIGAPSSLQASSQFSKSSLSQYLKNTESQEFIKPYTPQPDGVGRGAGLSGRTVVQTVETSTKSPTIYGSIPAWCTDVGIVIFPDTANIDTGEGMFSYTGYLGEAPIGASANLWELDLRRAGLGLINGKYNVYVDACMGDAAGGGPLYQDLFYDKIFIYPSVCNVRCTPVHRFYNKQNGAHFYTSSEHEKRQVMERKSTYRYEGISNFAHRSHSSGLVAVHRFYNLKTGTHFYTSSQQEAVKVNNTMTHTYRNEGVAYYAHTTPRSSRTPVHRFYKFKQGVHFYTANQSEATKVNSTMTHTYRYEGVSFYGIANRN